MMSHGWQKEREISADIIQAIAVTELPPVKSNKNTPAEKKKGPAYKCRPFNFIFGTRGRTRTGTLLRAGDFESPVSTNFTTLASL
jgi:hypothetical protein